VVLAARKLDMPTDAKRIAQNVLSNESDLVAIRTRTKQIAGLCGLGVQDQTRILTAVSEIARNALLYAHGGKVHFDILQQDGQHYLQISVSDSGPGIDTKALSQDVKGFVGSPSSLTSIKRLVDLVDISSSENGTTVSLRKLVPSMSISAKLAEWQKNLPSESPNAILHDLQDQNKQLMTALDDVQKVKIELEERTRQLQHANELKAQFLASVSHEIRTPMSAILGLVGILSKRAKDDEDRRLLGLLNESATSLLTMINDILDLSKIDEGKLVIDYEPFSLGQLLRSTMAIFANEAEKRSLSLVCNIEQDVPELLSGDVNRIRQIVVNLIGNALKFSDKGTITVSASLAWKLEDRVSVKIEIRDQGIGIKESDFDSLFEPFSQISNTSRKVVGTGLGLSICKRLIELLDGKIGVNSEIGVGSCFWFELPFTIVRKLDSLQPVPSLVPTFPGKRVLLAEDHPVNQMVAAGFLDDLGIETKIANNGFEVLSLIQEWQYDLILMDCQMPEMDGFETTAAIRDIEIATGKHIPIVAVTANAMAGDREVCLGSGMDDYISKPYDLNGLAAILSKWLVDQPKEYQKLIDDGALFKRFKKEQAKRLVETLLADAEGRIARMFKCLESSDLVALGHDAHALKGATSLVFMQEVSVTCGELQAACQQQDNARVRSNMEILRRQFHLTQIEARTIF
jgi:signal transduction histidine kinase/DNA-binding response OmpR family regulator